MNRHPYQPVSRAETISAYCTAFLVALGGAALIAATYIALAPMFATPAKAHDDAAWIMNSGKRNAAGEWCCGEGDCFVIPKEQVSYGLAPVASADEQRAIWGYTLFGVEFVPEGEAQPSPDGSFWRCKRPDGSRRCFFAPGVGS